jgi:hypothetical protein
MRKILWTELLLITWNSSESHSLCAVRELSFWTRQRAVRLYKAAKGICGCVKWHHEQDPPARLANSCNTMWDETCVDPVCLSTGLLRQNNIVLNIQLATLSCCYVAVINSYWYNNNLTVIIEVIAGLSTLFSILKFHIYRGIPFGVFFTCICLRSGLFRVTLGTVPHHTWRHTGAIVRYWYVYRVSRDAFRSFSKRYPSYALRKHDLGHRTALYLTSHRGHCPLLIRISCITWRISKLLKTLAFIRLT